MVPIFGQGVQYGAPTAIERQQHHLGQAARIAHEHLGGIGVEPQKAEARAHILRGYVIALDNLDAVALTDGRGAGDGLG